MMKRFWIVALAVAAGLFWREFSPALAGLDTNGSCPGNVCSGTVTVGGQAVAYSWTLNHDGADASLKVRFRSGPYTTSANPVRFRVTVNKAFSSNASLKNPSPLASLPPDLTVNAGKTFFERSSTTSTAGTTFDFVQDLRFVSPTPGTISVTLTVTQYGVASSVGPFSVSLDTLSPSNRDEGESLDSIYGAAHYQCDDGVDNDLDFRLDCADSDCTGEDIGSGSVCQTPETTCYDGEDNDGNGKIDCADPLCNGKEADVGGTKFCGVENGGPLHANCADGFDNDGNGKRDCYDDAPGTGCWKTGFQDCAATEISCTDGIDNDKDLDYSDEVDTNPATGPGTGYDCRDYDCKGLGDCTQNESQVWDALTGTFIDAPGQCTNGIDDDLDGDVDCADIDCLDAALGASSCARFEAYLPPSPLGTGLGLDNPAIYFNLCDDGKDNNGDGLTDGADADCKNVFGACGPSPAIEDYTFLSCGNAKDDDLNDGMDCADADCRASGKIGRAGRTVASCGLPGTACLPTLSTDAAACSVIENSANTCGDGIDNDGDGAIDCSDTGCTSPAQRHGPTIGSVATAPYFCGAESGATTCKDGADNDSDTGADCFDTACQDGTQCKQRPGAGGWSLAASCPTIPNTTGLTPIVAGGGINYAHKDRLYVSDPYTLRLRGTGSYTSVTIVVGDNAVAANAFPFDAGTCAIGGAAAANLRYTSPAPGVLVITEIQGMTVTNFDVTMSCTGSATPFGPEDFKLSVVANRSGVVEYGEATLTTQVYEKTLPTTPSPAVEVEGLLPIVGNDRVDVPVGGTVRIQGVPNDDPSGICRCDFTLEGVAQSTADGNCLATIGPFANDVDSFDIVTRAVDGASNRSAARTLTIDVNVVPSVEEYLVLGTDVNGATVLTYREGESVSLTTKFKTDSASTFPTSSTCAVYVYDENWTGGAAASATMVPDAVLDSALTCSGSYVVPVGLASGRYWIFVEATDSGGDVVRSNAQSFLHCESANDPAAACADADFDNDGTPEGRFTPGGFASPPTPTYPGEPQPRACDNCVNFYNPNQRDKNANGVGDSCEAGLPIGRCKYKQCGSTPDDLTPGVLCASDAICEANNPGDLCIVVDQPMCTVNCSVDADCQPPTAPATGVCSLDWGVCAEGDADEGSCCFSGADCLTGDCKALVKPFLETVSGQIYAGGDILAGETPPLSNATFCLQSGGLITNFTSARGCALAGSQSYDIPSSGKNYVGSFGTIDVTGILNGKYGALLQPGTLPDQLDGKIYYFPAGLTISAPITFKNSAGSARANGLVVVEGDLVIDADLSYQDRNESDLKNLASVGWIVLKNASGDGDVSIGSTVSRTVGAYFAEGTIDTGAGTSPLEATGVFVARNFSFNRQYASRTAGSERVIFDARVVLNPPPGLSDATRSLPGFSSVSGR